MNNRTIIASYKCSPHKITANQNHGIWKMSTCKTATSPRLRPEELEDPNFNIMILTTSYNKHSKYFPNFLCHVEKIDFEYGPRYSKMAKIGTFAGK